MVSCPYDIAYIKMTNSNNTVFLILFWIYTIHIQHPTQKPPVSVTLQIYTFSAKKQKYPHIVFLPCGEKSVILQRENMKRTLLILLLLATVTAARGQYLRLAGDTNRTALYLDASRIWNYNLYEHSRWGGGLLLSTHPQRFIFSRIDAEGYLGYGTFDEQWKYGIALTEYVRNSPFHSAIYQRFEHDYFAAGSRHLANPWSGGQLLGGFMSHRMTEERLVTFGYRWNTLPWRWAVEFDWGERRPLFDEAQLLYARQELLNYQRFGRLRLLLRHSSGFAAQYELFGDWKTMRLLAEYRRSIPLPFLKLDLYTQGGVTPKSNAYVDLFDLGGTWDAPVYIGNNLPTVSPNEFTANAFTLLSLRLQTARPLYSLYNNLFSVGSNPRPFVGLTAFWGTLWGQDANGRKTLETFVLQSPYEGLLEPVVGVDGIVRWGAVDLGAAIAYRIAPHSAPYHRNSVTQNLVLLISATLAQ